MLTSMLSSSLLLIGLTVLLFREGNSHSVTIKSWNQAGACDSSVGSLGSLALTNSKSLDKPPTVSGTFKVFKELNSEFLLSTNYTRLDKDGRRQLVRSRKGIICFWFPDDELLKVLPGFSIEPELKDCVVHAGEYSVKNFRFDSNDFSFYDAGKYEVDLELSHGNRRVCGAKMVISVD